MSSLPSIMSTTTVRASVHRLRSRSCGRRSGQISLPVEEARVTPQVHMPTMDVHAMYAMGMVHRAPPFAAAFGEEGLERGLGLNQALRFGTTFRPPKAVNPAGRAFAVGRRWCWRGLPDVGTVVHDTPPFAGHGREMSANGVVPTGGKLRGVVDLDDRLMQPAGFGGHGRAVSADPGAGVAEAGTGGLRRARLGCSPRRPRCWAWRSWRPCPRLARRGCVCRPRA